MANILKILAQVLLIPLSERLMRYVAEEIKLFLAKKELQKENKEKEQKLEDAKSEGEIKEGFKNLP